MLSSMTVNIIFIYIMAWQQLHEVGFGVDIDTMLYC